VLEAAIFVLLVLETAIIIHQSTVFSPTRCWKLLFSSTSLSNKGCKLLFILHVQEPLFLYPPVAETAQKTASFICVVLEVAPDIILIMLEPVSLSF
jgi:hypothetical protein